MRLEAIIAAGRRPARRGGDVVGQWSGMSFAAPFVTGMVARYLENNAGATRADVLDYLYTEAAAGYNALIDNGDGRWLPVVNVNDCY